MIKKWYAEMPNQLGTLLADRPAGETSVKSNEEREELERLREKEFLASEGNYTNAVREGGRGRLQFRAQTSWMSAFLRKLNAVLAVVRVIDLFTVRV